LAQNESEEDNADGETCIIGSFCLIILFIFFIGYLSIRQRTKARRAEAAKSGPSGHPHGYGHGYAQYRTMPPPVQGLHPEHSVNRKDVKCDLCSSQDLRFFEKGYVKCNDCKHVFYISEGWRARR
jgi:hypothetical protein